MGSLSKPIYIISDLWGCDNYKNEDDFLNLWDLTDEIMVQTISFDLPCLLIWNTLI